MNQLNSKKAKLERTATKKGVTGQNKPSAKDAALSYLSYQDRSMREMNTYLEAKGYTGKETEETLEFLTDCGFINDESYCERFVKEGVERRKSARKISDALMKKGISTKLINRMLEENLTEQITLQNAMGEAQAYMRKRELTAENKDMQKVMRRLFYLGYEPDIVYKTARALSQSEGADEPGGEEYP